MALAPGRVEEMIVKATANESCIPCHSTLYRTDVRPSICYGFYVRHTTLTIQIAERIGIVEWDDPPSPPH